MGRFFKRFGLLMVINFFIFITISLFLNLLGIQPYLSARGINFQALLIFCFLWGMGGAFISLALSRWAAKTFMGVRLIDPQTSDPMLRFVVDRVHTYAQQMGIARLPEVGVYQSPEVNAFATGPTRNRSLVAVSSGLLQNMQTDQIDGVLGHEVAHIGNGDMVTMTFIQGIVNAFVMFTARVLAFFISQFVNKDFRPLVHMITVIVLDILLSLLGMIVVAYFSRAREFRADKGGASLAGREKMVSALEALKMNFNRQQDDRPSIATLKIFGKSKGIAALFATHPRLDLRIQKLREGL